VKNRKSAFEYMSILKYAIIFLSFIIFNNVEREVSPYSTALMTAFITNGCSLFITPILYLLSFFVVGAPHLLIGACFPALILPIIVLIYKKARAKLRLELIFFTAISLVGYILIDYGQQNSFIEKRILTSAFTVILTYICCSTINAVTNKGFKFKFGFDEYVCLAVTTACLGLGVSNLISPYVWKGISVFILLAVCFVYRSGTGSLVSAVLGVTLAIHFQDLNYVSVFLVWNVTCAGFNGISRHVSALSIVAVDYLIDVVFNIYGGYTINQFIPVLCGALAFSVIPTHILKNIKEKLYSFREKQLVRQTINRNRLMLSNRLYELSSVFSEMASAFNVFKRNHLTDNQAREGIEKQVISSVCAECDNYDNCKRKEKSLAFSIGKMTDIGFAKGKLSFIDLDKNILDNCIHPNNVLYSINKLLADYRAYKIENANLISGREIIASEAVGVSEILRGLALETGALLKYQSRLERNLAEQLFKNGFVASELLIYGEEERTCVSVILTMKEFSLSYLQNVISNTLGMEMSLKDKADVSEDKFYLSFAKACDYDAVFGIAKVKKDGSNISGDTHSVVRISDKKFLVALSDGMGSGEYAENVSSTALSLIESFYKAGLNSTLILNTVNKLLTINTEDSFTALDVSVIDLTDCSADFIKYGSPYGFIVSDNGIRIIEGNSLPLGIVDELKPSVCNAFLNDGDMVVLVTDGVSDAFASSGEVIDYLRSVSAKNPQTLADDLLSHAVRLSGGNKKDDMTVLAVRVFKKAVSSL